MKTKITLAALAALMLAGATTRAGVETFSPGAAIPDGNLAGITFSGSVGDFQPGWTVSALTVGLNITGGYDGNLYAYLVAPNGTMVTLLAPSANSGSGMNITLQDGAPPITAGSDLSSGTYAASGALAGFNGAVANGTWQLFFADGVTGGGTSTLNSWSLNLTAVPEPVNVALGIFAGIMGLMALARSQLVKRLIGKS